MTTEREGDSFGGVKVAEVEFERETKPLSSGRTRDVHCTEV